jgi:ribosomal protein S18 acetylase RimI-like enzyme
MTTSVAVRRATASDAGVVSDALADAFFDDPVISWLIPPGISHRAKRVGRLWSASTASYLRKDKPVFVTEDGQGAALWSPPGAWATPMSEQLREVPAMIRVFGTGLVKASHVQEQMIKAHPRQPKHWYLYAIGARTGSQGRGIGSALLAEMLAPIDEAGEAAYLESSNERNVPLYERYGFAVVEELQLSGGGPTMWRMWRDPAR